MLNKDYYDANGRDLTANKSVAIIMFSTGLYDMYLPYCLLYIYFSRKCITLVSIFVSFVHAFNIYL